MGPRYPADVSTIPRERRIRVTELYRSIQGESTHAGKPCVFVRLTGCPLRCTWCDSAFTFSGGTVRDLDEVVAEASAFGIHTVEVTGGEPLAQPNAIVLMEKLLERGHDVLLETSGALSIADVPERVFVILDFKAPDSGEEARNHWENVGLLRPHHEVKFVLASRRDYDWAVDVTVAHDLASRCAAVLFSPAWGTLAPSDLVEWMLEDGVPARLGLQLHKVVWDPVARGV